MNSYLRPNPVIAPAIPRLHDVAESGDAGFLQSLINSLNKPTEVECPRCHGSGLLSLRGICERCLGRGHILTR